MRILQLSYRIPYPPIDGGRISIVNLTKHFFERGNEVHMVTIGNRREKNVDYLSLSSITSSLEVFWKDTDNHFAGLLCNLLFSRVPYTIGKYIHRDVEAAVIQAVRTHNIDIVHVDYLHMAHYAATLRTCFPDLPIVLRAHDVSHVIMDRMWRIERSWVKKAILFVQTLRMRNYERTMWPVFDAIIAMTDADKREIVSLTPGLERRVHVIPAGVDIRPLAKPRENAKPNLLYLATLDWLPNQQGLDWFLAEVLPLIKQRIPDATLLVAGKGLPDKYRTLDVKQIETLGFVDNLEALYDRTTVAIVPLWIGGGMRIKILNYFASGVPVVATGIGCEGIKVVNGKHLLIANDPRSFADAVVRLLTDKILAAALRHDAYGLVQREYSWPTVIDRICTVYEALRRHQPCIVDTSSR